MLSILIHRRALKYSTWIWVAVVLIVSYWLLKSWQICLEQDTLTLINVITHIPDAAQRRINDFSFAMLVSACVSAVFLSEAFKRYIESCFRSGATITVSPSVRLHAPAQLWWCAWVAFCWFLYLQAMYRDNGTFFFVWDNAQSQPNGSAIVENEATIRSITLVQVVEGIFNLLVIALIMGWGVLGHALLNRAEEPGAADRQTRVSEGYLALAKASLAPIAAFTIILAIYVVLERNRFLPSFFEGVKDIVKAVATAVAMWLIFIALFLRTMAKGHEVIQWSAWPILVRPRERLHENDA